MRLTYFKLIATVFFWGSNFAVGKVALQSMGPYSVAFMRFVFGSILLLGYLYRSNGGFPAMTRKQWGWAFVSGATGVFLYNLAFFSGIQYMPTVRASLIISFAPVTITLGSALFLGEKVTPVKWAGIFISLIGVVVVVSRGKLSGILSNATWGLGEMLILGSVLSWTVYTILAKVALKTIAPASLSSFSAMIGCLLLLVPAWHEGLFSQLPLITWAAWLAVIYMGITATALGFIWYYDAVRQIGASKAAAVGNLTPVFAVIIAVTVLNEELTFITIIGGALVLLGVWLTTKN